MAIGERILLARRIARLTQRGLAAQAGVSAAAICKYEKNRDTPGSGVLLRLAKALDVRVEFFLRPPRIQQIVPSFRTRAAITEAEEATVLGRIQEWLERYLETEEIIARHEPDGVARFEFPKGFRFAVRALPEASEAAAALRACWELGRDAIENLTELLEMWGIKVGIVDAHVDFDACAFWAVGERRVPVIAVREGAPGDRQRFSLAHELGHLLLQFPDDWEPARTHQAANRFASEFLLPAKAVRSELGRRRHSISLYELHMLKHRYGVSMQTWLYRAKDLGILAEADAVRLLKPFQESEWKRHEPGDDFVPEQPTRLERLVMHALAEDLISDRKASELLGKPLDQFTQEVARDHGGLPVAVCGGC
jgi:Zn-dependent peptidase ImmA (M78 family)/DNA-binding XRE family transcriptional regulator